MKEALGHCPYCTKILFKDAVFRDEADFETNCHHCGKPILVEAKKIIVINVKPRIQVRLHPDQKQPMEKVVDL